MRSTYKMFRGTSGIEDVLVRANEFVNRVGREQLIGINTFIDPSDSRVAGVASRISRGADPETVVAIVWYWEPSAVKATDVD